VQKHVKVKFLDVPGEFVGTEFHQNLELGICELKSSKYWEAALERLSKYFPKGGKERWNPLSIYNEKRMMEEVSEKNSRKLSIWNTESYAELHLTRHRARSWK
jgi:hypothetical protein